MRRVRAPVRGGLPPRRPRTHRHRLPAIRAPSPCPTFSMLLEDIELLFNAVEGAVVLAVTRRSAFKTPIHRIEGNPLRSHAGPSHGKSESPNLRGRHRTPRQKRSPPSMSRSGRPSPTKPMLQALPAGLGVNAFATVAIRRFGVKARASASICGRLFRKLGLIAPRSGCFLSRRRLIHLHAAASLLSRPPLPSLARKPGDTARHLAGVSDRLTAADDTALPEFAAPGTGRAP